MFPRFISSNNQFNFKVYMLSYIILKNNIFCLNWPRIPYSLPRIESETFFTFSEWINLSLMNILSFCQAKKKSTVIKYTKNIHSTYYCRQNNLFKWKYNFFQCYIRLNSYNMLMQVIPVNLIDSHSTDISLFRFWDQCHTKIFAYMVYGMVWTNKVIVALQSRKNIHLALIYAIF